jgi:hypothetical protein
VFRDLPWSYRIVILHSGWDGSSTTKHRQCGVQYLPELDGAVVRGEHAQGAVRPRAPPHPLDLLADLQAVQHVELCTCTSRGVNGTAALGLKPHPAGLMNSSIDRWLTSGSWLWNSVAKLYLGGGGTPARSARSSSARGRACGRASSSSALRKRITRPAWSPAARYSPRASNSIAEISSAATCVRSSGQFKSRTPVTTL